MPNTLLAAVVVLLVAAPVVHAEPVLSNLRVEHIALTDDAYVAFTDLASIAALLAVERGGAIGSPPFATWRHQQRGMRGNYARSEVVEGKGFEPSTSALRTPRSPN